MMLQDKKQQVHGMNTWFLQHVPHVLLFKLYLKLTSSQ